MYLVLFFHIAAIDIEILTVASKTDTQQDSKKSGFTEKEERTEEIDVISLF